MSVLADMFLSHKLHYSKNCKGECFVWGDQTSNCVFNPNPSPPFAARMVQHGHSVKLTVTGKQGAWKTFLISINVIFYAS